MPFDRTTVDGKLYAWMTGLGWVEVGGESVCIYDDSMYENGNKVGEMGKLLIADTAAVPR